MLAAIAVRWVRLQTLRPRCPVELERHEHLDLLGAGDALELDARKETMRPMYLLFEEHGKLVIRRRGRSLVFTISADDRYFAERLIANLLDLPGA
jgi:hypothetical protein